MKRIILAGLVFIFANVASIADAQLLKRQPIRNALRAMQANAGCGGMRAATASCGGIQTATSCSGLQAASSCGGSVINSMAVCYEPIYSRDSLVARISATQPIRAAVKALVAPLAVQSQCTNGVCAIPSTVVYQSILTPTVIPEPVPMPEAFGAPQGAANYFKDRIQFRRGLLEACQRAEDKSVVQNGTTFALGRRLRLHPGELTEIMKDAEENAEIRGIGAPDWNAFLDFLERLIPIIIKLIDLFSMDVDTAINAALCMDAAQQAALLAA